MRARIGPAAAAGLLVVLAAGGPAAADAARWSWPTASHRVVRDFAAPAAPWAAGHRGIDVAAADGEAVRAPADGVVAVAGRVVDRGVVAIDHGGVRSTLEPVDPVVAPGDVVHRGEVVGHVHAGGAHRGVLHLGARIRVGDGWAYVSPLLLLGGVRRAVLLPLAAFP